MKEVLNTEIDVCNFNTVEMDFTYKLAELEQMNHTIINISDFDVIDEGEQEGDEYCIGKVYVHGSALFVEGTVDECIEQIKHALKT